MIKNNKNSLLKLKISLVICVLLLSTSSIMVGANRLKGTTVNENGVTVISADHSGVDFSLSIGDFRSEVIEANGKFFQQLHLPNGGHTSDYGKAELPTLSFYVAVPQGAEVQLDYDISDYKILTNYDVYPSQPPKPETEGFTDPPFTMNESFYSRDEFYPDSVVEITSEAIMRGCRIIRVSVFPFAYNPVTKLLCKYESIDISIDFIGGTGEFIPKRLRSTYFQPLFDAYLINAQSVERAEVNNPTNPGALGRSNRADLLIVVYDDFYDEILPLAEWRHQTGIETKVVKWSDVGTNAQDLRDYVSDAYHNWELPPSFLLIVGDADHIPVNYLYTHPYHGSYTGTDHWYVAFDGNDYLPELHAGRISVEDETELTTVVNKILDYSKTPYMGTNWFDDVLLAAYQEYGRYFIYTSERIYDFLSPLGYNCNRQYQGSSPPGSTTGVIDAINNGVIIANHRDHGAAQNDGYAYTGWSYPRFDTTHIPNLNNGEMYPVMYALHCDSGWFDGETDSNSGNWESIGEVGIRVENKGFVAVIASTRVSYSGYNDELCVGLFDAMWSDFDPNYPNGGSTNPYTTEVYRISQVLNYGKFWLHDKYIVPGGCPPYPWTPSYAASRATFEMIHVHGDPTMEVWTAFPQNLDVEYTILLDILQVLVTSNGNPVEGALVCITQESGLYVKGLTDATGSVDLGTSLASTEEITLTVTAHNYLYYQDTFHLNRPPEIPSMPSGSTSGKEGSTYTYETDTTDPEGDQISYMWDWGDGTFSDWIGPFDSGVTASASHIWNERGSFYIKVKAKDTNDAESDWSDELKVSISNTAPTKPWITGKRIGSVGQTYEYSFRSFDLEGDNIYYIVTWDYGGSTGWLGPYNSGYKLTLNHTWDEGKTHTVRAKAKDIFDEESKWATMKVLMPVNQPGNINQRSSNPLFFQILEQLLPGLR